jgi:phosphoserine phosphatase
MGAKEHGARVAAFFDLDGTLMPRPSMERRLFRVLRCRREIPPRNYFSWLREALKLLPRGVGAVKQANKMYLEGVHSLDECGAGSRRDFPAHQGGHQAEGQALALPRRNPRLPVPCFFEEAVERVTCHAMLGHAIVIVSGTLAPLAALAAGALEMEIAARGFARKIRVCATRLEERKGQWTGRIVGEAMFGQAKARAVAALAHQLHLDLKQCWAYGDSANDRGMLEAVGKPVTVNPTWKLARIALKRDWPMLRWRGKRDLPPSHREHKAEGRSRLEAAANNSRLSRAGQRA